MERKGRLDDKVAFITGVAKADGIGFATATAFAEEGATVAIADISERVHDCAASLRERGFTVSSHTADLTKGEQVRRIVEEALVQHGRIDVLVNNAGMVICGQDARFTPFQELTEEEWDFEIAINLKTQFLVTRAVVPHMIARGYGRIVNVSSVTGPLVANPAASGYCAGKAGVLGMTRGVALDVAKYGITVNAVGPGWIATGSQSEGEDVGGLNTPLGRSAYPSEVARVICFLGSDEANYVTGQLVVVDGGNTIQEYKGPSELYY
jgi:3-oxoacyl-[acyl-carrier protein] reductase